MWHSVSVKILKSRKLADEMTMENFSHMLYNDWNEHVRLSICL